MANRNQQIMDALVTRFGGIASGQTVPTEDGNSHTYTFTPKNVFDSDDTALGTSELPAINLIDEDMDCPEEGICDVRNNRLAVDVELRMVGATAVSDIRAAVADLVAAIGTDPSLGLADSVYDVVFSGRNIDVQTANKACVTAKLLFVVHFRTDLWSI